MAVVARDFAGYSVVRRLAEGGMTHLFVALDPSHNRVVIRQLGEVWARQWRHRRGFFHCGEVLAKMNHPNVVRLIKMGRDDQLPYMVLEYIESHTLRDLILHRDPFLTVNVMPLMRQIAAAINYIHASGYLHLDIKPENILVTAEGRVVVIDFDLAVRRKHRPIRIRMLPGTPSYIAPEVILKHTVDERADIYSFGMTCYEMCVFHKPFEGDKIEQVRAAQVDPRVQPTPLRQHNPDIPPARESLILKCLAKQHDDRYPSMRLVSRDLEAIL